MQNTSQSVRAILFAAEPALEGPTREFAQGLFAGNIEFESYPYEKLARVEDIARETNAGLIVLAVPAGDDGRLDPRSTFGHVSLDSDVPVLVLRVPDGEEPQFGPITRIVVPLDGSATAAQAIPLASQLARMGSLPVQFVMVIDPSRVIPAAYAYDPEAWGIISDLRQTAHWALRQSEGELRNDGIEVHSDLLFGPVNACLTENVQDGDLIVMTTHGSGRASRRRVGSVAERVLAVTPQPIVIMRAAIQGDVVVEGYEACSWVEPLHNRGRA